MPYGFEVRERGSHHFLLEWDPPANPNGILTGYVIKYQMGMYRTYYHYESVQIKA